MPKPILAKYNLIKISYSDICYHSLTSETTCLEVVPNINHKLNKCTSTVLMELSVDFQSMKHDNICLDNLFLSIRGIKW